MHTFYHYNSSHCIFSLPPSISNTSQRMNNQIFHFALFYISSFIAIHLLLPITAHSNTSQKTFWHLPHFLSMLLINAALPKEKYFTISIHCSNG